MKLKILVALVLGVSLLFLSSRPALAGLVTIDKTGQVILKVLSTQDSLSLNIPKNTSIEFKSLALGEPNAGATVSLLREGDRVQMKVAGDGEDHQLDVTTYPDDLIEIEERGEAAKIKIRNQDQKFTLEQNGILAQTDFPIQINAAKAEISVATPSGDRFLAILPWGAVESLLRARSITSLADTKLQLVENEKRDLVYVVNGEKKINFFNLVNYDFPAQASVSALTGEIISVEPTWLRILSFLFT